MKKLMYILFFLMTAFNLAAQKNYVIDSVCVGVSRSYQIIGEKGSTYEWYVYDTLGNVVLKPTHIDFWVSKSPGDTTWSSKIKVPWNDIGEFDILTLHFSEHGCDTLEQGRIKVFPDPEADAGKDMIVCKTEPIILASATASNYSSLVWTTIGDGTFDDDSKLNSVYTPGVKDSITGSVTLIFTAHGLADNVTCIPVTDTLKIQFGNPIIKLNPHNLLCFNDNSGSIKVNVTGGIGPFSFNWFGPGSFKATGDSIFGLATGKYTVSVTDNLGCVVTGSVEITQPDKLIAGITQDKNVICFGDSIKLTGTPTGGTALYKPLWSGVGVKYLTADTINVPTFKNAPAGLYKLIFTVTDANGCFAADTLAVTVNPVYNNIIPLTVCENDLPYNWRGQMISKVGFYTDSLSSINGCDSVLTLNFDIWPVSRDTMQLTVCENKLPYNWQGLLLKIPGFYSDTLLSVNFCDSIKIMNFDVWPVSRDTMQLAVCENELPYNWHGKLLNMAGYYSDTLSSIHNCDSIRIVNFDIWPVPRDTMQLAVCDNKLPYNWHGKLLNSAGFYSDTLSSIHGCDSVLILNFDIWPVYRDTIPMTVCENKLPYNWRGRMLNSAGIYSDTLSGIHNCDSVLFLDFEVLPVINDTLSLTICSSELPYTWFGQVFTSGDTIFINIPSVTAGCDTIRMLRLKSVPEILIAENKTICENELPYTWHGAIFTNADTLTQKIASVTASCDTIRLLQLQVNPLLTDTLQLTVCANQLPYNWQGEIFTTADTIIQNIISVTTSCDTIRVLQLQVNPLLTDTLQQTICENLLPYKWHGEVFTGADTIVQNIVSVTLGCDTIRVLQLIVNPLLTDTLQQTICENLLPYKWHGEVFTAADTIIQNIISVTSGCDTIRVLQLEVNPLLKDTIQLTVCENLLPYNWFGHIFNAAGTAIINIPSGTAGCDTIRTLELQTVPEIIVKLDTTICVSEVPFNWNGNSYKVTGVYNDTIFGTTACDTVLILDLKVMPEINIILDTTICANETPFKWYGKDYVASGIYKDTLVSVTGCDTLLILELEVLPEIRISLDTIICAAETPFKWYGTEYFNTGVYHDTLISAKGCDTILTLDLKVEPDMTVSLTIVADKTEVDEGETVTFTATPVNEGTVPVYAWFVNDILIPGATSVTYNFAPNDGDVVYAVLTSDLVCTLGNPATSNKIPIKVNIILPVSVTIAADQVNICQGSSVTFTATPVNGGTNPVYAWFVNGVVVSGATSATYTYLPQNGDVVYAVLTSSLTNVTGNPATSNEITITIRKDLPVIVNIFTDKTEICDGETVTFTTQPVNGGTNPVYAWFVNNIEMSGETSAIFTYTPKNSDLVYARLTSNLACAFGNPAISNKIPIKVNDNASVSVTIEVDKTDICESEYVTFTALPQNGGPNPGYAWFVNKVEVPGETSNTFTYQPKDKDAIYTVLTSDLMCTTDDKAFSNIKRINVTNGIPVSVSVIADKTEICEGEKVTYTASAVNGGTIPVYSWYVNGVAVSGAISAVFTYSPQKGDEVYTLLTSDVACPLGNPATSNKITVVVNEKQPVSVSIDEDKNFICVNESITFTATPVNGGINPVYTWYVNNIQVSGVTSDSFTYQPKDDDVVHALLTSNQECITDNPAVSNKIIVSIVSELPVSVSIIADKNIICEGDTLTYSATPVNGGPNPLYTWFVNGVKVTGATKQKFVYAPKKGDVVYTMLTSDFGCVTGNPATSNKVIININDKAPVSISIAADKTDICKGEKVTFTAIPVNGGTNPVYKWFVNGIAVPGETDIIFKYKPDEGDEIYVKLISNATCVTDSVALSNTIKIKFIAGLLVEVDIAADKTKICSGETVNFTAAPVNGGDKPVYTWFVNGKKINGVTSAFYAYKPADKDKIYVKLTSSEFCVIDPDALSDTIVISITDGLTVDVDITADKTTICNGEKVAFAATPVNGGDNPLYAWFVNGIEIKGETGVTFNYKPKNGDQIYVKLTSSEFCAINPVALSDKITIKVTNNLVVTVTLPDQELICKNTPVKITAKPVNGGVNPVYKWFVNKIEIGGENAATLVYTPKDKDKVFVTLESDLNCVTQKTDTSNVIVINVGDNVPPEAICRNITVYLDIDGKASITSSQIDNGSKDNCELDTILLSKYNFSCADVGKNQVTLTAIDAVGLSDFCNATVTVLDTIKPVITCRGPFEIQLDENAEYKLTVVEVQKNVSDACGTDTTYVYPHLLDCDHIGLTTIRLWAVGVNGDSAYCETQVTIYGNRAPNVMDDSASTFENIPVIIEAVSNDYDEKTAIDISTLAISIKPLHGTVTINPVNGDLTYTPDLNFSGVDVLEYRICDDGIPCEPECGKAFVIVNVKPVNDQAVAGDDYYEAGCFSVTGNVMDNDYDIDSDNLTINTNPLSPTSHGELIIDPDGTIYYFPNEGFIGIDSFEYVICDNGVPSLCDTAKVFINVDCSEETHDPLDCELFIPEGFSPNEDGIHDFFRIMCIHNYPDAKLMIFNHNGNLLWEKEHYGNYDFWGDQYNAWWWGTSVLSQNDVGRQMINSEPRLKPGNYVYVLHLGGKDVKNGTVMVAY